MNIAYYISAHGFGHGIRATAICGEFSPGVKLFVRTALPERFVSEKIRRPFTLAQAAFDCGCLQRDGITVDIGATVKAYREIARRNAGLLQSEIAWCRHNNISVIVSDIAPFPFEVAAALRIPAAAVTNFTWLDIYRPFCRHFPSFAADVDKIEAQYACATTLLALFPALPMPYFKRSIPFGPIGRRGQAHRAELAARLGCDPGKRLGLIYLGTQGLPQADWPRLAQFTEWEFVGLYALAGAPQNYHVLADGPFSYQDIVASVDLMIAKAGYGVCMDCFLHGLPLLYVGRDDFAEYPALAAELDKWGHGYRLAPGDFTALAWHEALTAVLRRPKPELAFANDAARCARQIEALEEETH
ncbi:MAG: hypothetical protein PHC61_12945 [Chitinivibrionales bacterium]|nr:hypothetical protein [Chitinivibrionales bacterium]